MNHNNRHHPPRRRSDSSPHPSNQTDAIKSYDPPRLKCHGSLGPLIRGASWKGLDNLGQLDPENAYPG